MIKYIVTLFVTLLTFLMHGQVKKNYTISGDINKLVVSMPFEVIVDATSSSNVIRIEANSQTELDRVDIKQNATTLTLDMNTNNRSKLSLSGKTKIYISQSKIADYNISTTAKVIVNGRVKATVVKVSVDAAASLTANFIATSATIRVDSAGSFEGDISAKNITAVIDSAGKVVVSGDTENLTVNVDSAGKFDGKALKGKHIKVEADSMGKAEVFPIESLNAYADSMGKVVYHNTPKEVKKKTDSMGSVKEK